jgi:hypothetical protein
MGGRLFDLMDMGTGVMEISGEWTVGIHYPIVNEKNVHYS